ncbi:IS3 family transposase [Allosaccharopolyspora coralli]|uniref:IS3 family transposase n=1 Tax=Allosaccharopolyspora coralli TaxID=2665642 RepID=A0A5Q3Q7Z9_9PSEU|nr:IS3 family transposase [Allosaccharopolyspora coralli]QGK69310.1 IS3 family transposase [Allosaccharopolyspora coralli]QGK69314.1 IS3 family transposase [Allosaccharopolyspora coralli]
MVTETGRTVAEVARELGLNQQTLRNWVNAYEAAHDAPEPSLSVSERARLRELEEENRQLRMKTEFLGKSSRLLCQRVSVSQRYAFIAAEKDTTDEHGVKSYTVENMCAWLNVSKSGFYDWLSRPESDTDRRRRYLGTLIKKCFDDSDGTYGHRRIHAWLARCGEPATPELVRSIMRDQQLVPCQPRPWRPSLTQASTHVLPDLLKRDFTAREPGEKLVGDITYIPTGQGWVYLATVIDCYSKAVVGWAIDDHYRTPLIEKAIHMAARNHTLPARAIFHSDRGSNYTSADFAMTLHSLGIRQSVGRTGICFDNAMAESFFATLKNERVHRVTYLTKDHAKADIASYIELRYNHRRLHSAIGYKAPNEAHAEYYNHANAA